MKAIIMAGGLGKRLGSANKNTPKPMTLIYGKPVLQYQIEALKKEGITEFIFVVGYLAYKIEEYFKDGADFGVNISYFREEEPLGTAGALFKMQLTEDFILCNGDLIFDLDIKNMIKFHYENNALATLFTHPNNHPYDSAIVCADTKGCIKNIFLNKDKPQYYQNLCNAGIQIISPKLLEKYSISGAANLERDVIIPAIQSNLNYSNKSSEYVRDMGTPERLEIVKNDIKSGIIQSKHRKRLQKAVFLDRDGTINKLNGFITKPDEIELIDGVPEAISTFHNLGYLVIIVTNQPVIARGECTVRTLNDIHNCIETLLGEKGAYVDGIYYCPHHPDSGFEGEIKELKITCDCRKPAPGLLIKAQRDFNIDLSKSFMIGDSIKDIIAGKNAGCQSFLIDSNSRTDIHSFNSLYDFSVELSNKQI